MLYAINVLKKIIMKEKSYILFWKVKKMWILKHVCLQSTPWTMFCLMKSLCYYCPTFPIPVFSTTAIVLLCYASSSVFYNHSINGDHSRLCQTKAFAQRLFVVRSMFSSLNHLHNLTVAAAATAAAVLKQQLSVHTTTLTAWLVLIVCFFSLAIKRVVTWL